MSFWLKDKVGIRRRPPTYEEYAAILSDNGRSDEEIQESIKRNKEYRPMLYSEGPVLLNVDTTNLRPSDFAKLLGPSKGAKRKTKCCPHCGGAL